MVIMFKDFIYNKYIKYKINRLIKKGYLKKTLEPIKCFHCKHDRLYWKIAKFNEQDNKLEEEEVTCQKCKNIVGYCISDKWSSHIYK